MQRIFLLISTIFFASNIYAQSKNSIVRIEYSSMSRGGLYKDIRLSKDSVLVKEGERRAGENKEVRRKATHQEWTKGLRMLKKVTLSKIPDLKSPTMKRAFDGARHSEIRITMSDGKIYAHGFDDDDPHPTLKELVHHLLKLSISN